MGTITVNLGTGEEHVLPWNDESTLAVVNISRPDPWNKFEARHAFSDVASVKINVKADATPDEGGGAEVAGGEGEAQPEPEKLIRTRAMTREELNLLADRFGVESAEKMRTKAEVQDAIRAAQTAQLNDAIGKP